MSDRARIRINLAQREVEIEGSEAFVREWAERLEELLPTAVPPMQDEVPASMESAATGTGSRQRPPFGQFIQGLSLNVTDVDRMLAAGYWLQLGAGDDCYGTGPASRLLEEQGFKIGNPSQCVKQSLLAKRAFLHQRGRYRVTPIGRAHLRQLMGEVIDTGPVGS